MDIEGEKNGEKSRQKKPQIADWRYGLAQLWYDMLGVDDAGEDFDYGLRCKEVRAACSAGDD